MTQPEPNGGGQVVALSLMSKLIQRADIGVATYGQPLRTFDGRVNLYDALDEALDLAVYIEKEILERQQLDYTVKLLKRVVAAWDAPLQDVGKEKFEALIREAEDHLETIK